MIQRASDLLGLLAARQDLPRVWGRFDHGRPGDGTSQMLIVAGVAAVLAVAMLIWHRAARRPHRYFVFNSPPRLFRDLCNAHGLTFSSRRLLKRLASERGVASPALMFVEPEHFDTSNLPASLQPAAKDLQQLRDQLFGCS